MLDRATRCVNRSSLTVFLVLACCMAACTSSSPPQPGAAPNGSLEATTGSPDSALADALLDLPWPGGPAGTNAPPRAAAASGIWLMGAGYHLKSANATVDDTRLQLAAGPQETSWGIYRYQGVADAEGTFSISVELAGGLLGQYYVGVADFNRQAWHWISVDGLDTNSVDVPPECQIASPDHEVYVAVVLWDDQTGSLSQLGLFPPQYTPYGLCFGPFKELDPNQGDTVTRERVASLLDPVAPYCRWVRVHGSTKGLEHVPDLAKAHGLMVAGAAWLSADPAANADEITGLTGLIQAGYIDLAIVGTEVLYRGDLEENQLIAFIQQIRTVAEPAGVPVTTNDTWSELLAHPAVMAECDVIMANFFPYWEGITVSQALRSLHVHYGSVRNAAGGKEVIVGETGWPSAGDQIGGAVASAENAALYFLNFVSWARIEDVKFFYFEVYDELWKASYEGPQGAHWGIWDQNGLMKPGMIDVFNGLTMTDNWSDSGEIEIIFTYVPPYGSFDDLVGLVSGVNPAGYKVAVYIRVEGFWWTKPYDTSPLTEINWDGTWVCDITTGGIDEQATRIAAYLVPNGYVPPLCYGDQELPAELDANSVAQAYVDRSP